MLFQILIAMVQTAPEMEDAGNHLFHHVMMSCDPNRTEGMNGGPALKGSLLVTKRVCYGCPKKDVEKVLDLLIVLHQKNKTGVVFDLCS